jgi:2'-5' RNA ligase
MAEKLILVGAVEEMKPFQDQDWPLHVTVMPWFSVPKKFEDELIDEVADYTRTVRPLRVIGDVDKIFGPLGKPLEEVKVRTLRNTARIALLHTGILDIINHYGAEVHSPYIRDLYQPHVTYQRGSGIEKDQEIILENLQLVRGDVSGPRIVEHTFELAKDTSQ